MPRIPRIVQETYPPTEKKISAADQAAQLELEWENMRTALACAVMAWAGLENSLAELLDAVIRPPKPPDPHLCMASGAGKVIYNAPNNTETRFKLIDDILMHKIFGEYHQVAIAQIWKKLLLVINRYKETRNKIIHGSTIEYEKADGRIYVRHTFLVNDVMADLKPWINMTTSTDHHAAHEKLKPKLGQLPGMSAHDIMDASNKFDEMADSVDVFTEAMSWVTGHGHNYNTSREKLLRAAAHLKITDLQIGAPTETESLAPPESWEE